MVDGWILGPNSELLFWVPPLHRTALWRPSNISVIGRHAARIDFRHFVHGISWARCLVEAEEIDRRNEGHQQTWAVPTNPVALTGR